MSEQSNPVWWIELIKILPGLIAAVLTVGLVISFRKELRALAVMFQEVVPSPRSLEADVANVRSKQKREQPCTRMRGLRLGVERYWSSG